MYLPCLLYRIYTFRCSHCLSYFDVHSDEAILLLSRMLSYGFKGIVLDIVCTGLAQFTGAPSWACGEGEVIADGCKSRRDQGFNTRYGRD